MTKTYYDTKFGGRIYIDANNNKSVDYSYVLTTTPERIEEKKALCKTIESLKNQTVKPKHILIAIPNHYLRWGIDYDVPKWLEKMSGVDIVRCNDYGPATKWMCASYADTEYVIVCDDDREFKNEAAEILIENLDKNESASFYGMWWWIDKDDKSKGVDESFLICQAADSWIVPTKKLKDFPAFWYRAFNFYEQSFYVDDVVASAYMKYKKMEYTCIDFDDEDESVGAATDLSTSFSKYSLLNMKDDISKLLRMKQQTDVRDNMLEMIEKETNSKQKNK